MRITIILLLLGVFQVSAINSYSQQTRISVNFSNTRLSEVLNAIENQSKYYFLYNQDLVDVNRKVSLKANEQEVSSVLDELFNHTKVKYVIHDRQIILTNLDEIESVQQNSTITGEVTNKNGEPIPGATIVIKGTSNGTITDADGHYRLTNVPTDATLVFSFVGMNTKEVAMAGQTTINVVLEEATIGLDEVVAIGYGTQKKVTVTGSVVATDGNELVKSKTPNVLNSITGHLAGVIINNRSGEPGRDDPNILIRGKGTTGNTQPLILIDGIESNDLGRINPNDIESISVLKDASAAIYGARAANGVILVTTKQGKKGAPVFNFSYNQGFSQPTRKTKMADSYTFAKVYNEIETQAGRTPVYTDAELEKYKSGTDPNYPNTNWYDVMIKDMTPSSQTNISVSGGSDRLDYYLSLGQQSQDGHFNYGSTKVKLYNFRSNINVHVSDDFTIGFDISGRYDDKHYPGNPETRGIYSHMFLYRPMWTLFWPGTDYLRPNRDSESLVNWVSDNGGWQNEKYKAMESKLRVKYDVPWVKGLSLTGSANYDSGYSFVKRFAKPTYVYYHDAETNTYTEGRSGQGSDLAQLSETFEQGSRMTVNAQINYEKDFGNHHLNVMVGYEQMEQDSSYMSAGRTDFPSTVLPQLFAGSSDKSKQSNDGSASKTSRQNYFGRITYDYSQKYLAQLIFRYDGSPNFPSNKRWGFFPGISLGWRMSEEPFMQNVANLDNLKLRASYGEMGNDAVPPFQYLTSYAYNNNYVLGNNDVIGLVQSGVANPNITWEVAKSTNFGFEASLWDGGLGVDLDVFKTKRSNILTKRTAVIPDYTGLTLPDENVGIVENKGFELQLSHRKKVSTDIRYSLNGNFSYARNKVIFADEAPAAEDYQLATGRPIGASLFYDAIGIYGSQDEINGSPHLPGAQAGDIIYRDVNKDGEINSRDMIRIDQTPTPEIVYSVIGSVNYKNFDISIMLQGQENAKTYVEGQGVDDTNPYFEVMSYNLGNFLAWRANDRWSEENTTATQPRGSVENFNNNTLKSTHWLLNAGFLRLKNLEIGYSIPANVCQKIGVKGLRAYLSGHNLMIIYDHMKDLGFDPETSDFWYYSQQRTFNIGVNLTF